MPPAATVGPAVAKRASLQQRRCSTTLRSFAGVVDGFPVRLPGSRVGCAVGMCHFLDSAGGWQVLQRDQSVGARKAGTGDGLGADSAFLLVGTVERVAAPGVRSVELASHQVAGDVRVDPGCVDSGSHGLFSVRGHDGGTADGKCSRSSAEMSRRSRPGSWTCCGRLGLYRTEWCRRHNEASVPRGYLRSQI